MGGERIITYGVAALEGKVSGGCIVGFVRRGRGVKKKGVSCTGRKLLRPTAFLSL